MKASTFAAPRNILIVRTTFDLLCKAKKGDEMNKHETSSIINAICLL